MIRRYTFLFAALLLLTFAACSKSDNPSTPAPTADELLYGKAQEALKTFAGTQTLVPLSDSWTDDSGQGTWTLTDGQLTWYPAGLVTEASSKTYITATHSDGSTVWFYGFTRNELERVSFTGYFQSDTLFSGTAQFITTVDTTLTSFTFVKATQ